MVDEFRTAKLVVDFLESLGLTLQPGAFEGSLLESIQHPKLTTLGGIMKYFQAISDMGDNKVFDTLYDLYTQNGLDDFEVAQLLIKKFMELIFDTEEVTKLISENPETYESLSIDLSLAIKNNIVRSGVSLVAWIRLNVLRGLLPRIKELYGPSRITKPQTAAQIRKEKEEEQVWQDILDQKPESSDSEAEPVADNPSSMETEMPDVHSEPEIINLEEEIPFDIPEPEPVPEPKKKKSKTKKSKKAKKAKKTSPYPVKELLEVNDYLVIMEEVKIKSGIAEPKMGFKEATELSKDDDGEYKIVKATDYNFGDRVWGAKIHVSFQFLQSGKTDLTFQDVKHVGPFGVQEVNISDNSVFRILGNKYEFKWIEGKRWLNLSTIVSTLRNGTTTKTFPGLNPYLAPKSCSSTKDYKGVDIDENGNKILDVGLEISDKAVMRRSTVANSDLQYKNAETMLDTGASRNEISSTVAQALKLYDPKVQKDLGVIRGGEIQTTTGSYTVLQVDLEYKMTANDLFHTEREKSLFPPDFERKAILLFQFPEDPNQNSNFDVLLGREGHADFGIRIHFL
jgi:hypothetical protein